MGQRFPALVDSALGGGREHDEVLHTLIFLQLFRDTQHGGFCLTKLQFVGLRGQNHERKVVMFTPFHHHLVEIGERVPDVHHQNQATQAAAIIQVMAEMLLPVVFHVPGHFRIAVTGQVDQTGMFPIQAEKVDQPGPAGRFTGAGQFAVGGDSVQGAGFARIGAAGKGNFSAMVGGAFVQFGGADEKTGAVEREAFLIAAKRALKIQRSRLRRAAAI